MMQQIIGWDIGGAHVKAALLDGRGEVVDISLRPCPLWKGLEYLRQAVTSVLQQFRHDARCHAITMTGELVDLFENREQGVKSIIEEMRRCLGNEAVSVYAGRQGFLAASTPLSAQNCLDIASMNWLASATLAAQRVGDGLFVDIGSTTTDILLFTDGQVEALGLTDYQRLVSAELVYTGIVRTAVMAVATEALFNGRRMGLMAEYFATMADVYRLTGELHEAHDQSDTADGGPKTALASARRLSRMTGYDFNEAEWPLWLDFAAYLKARQKAQIAAACKKQLRRAPVTDRFCFVGAGIGRFLVEQIAQANGFPYLDFNDLIGGNARHGPVEGADCAAAVAVARLALGVC